MIIRREDIQQNCADILSAVDSNELSVLTETLELYVENGIFYMNVTNREYYAQVRFNLGEDEDFRATVNANLFLRLIAQITTDTIEMKTNETSLLIKGNGTYKLPLIFDGDKLLKLPEIIINNVTAEFDVNSDILMSILQYNSKQLTVGTISKPIQKLYYVDEHGALTFTSGACVNNFTLPQPVKMLLNKRLVKLFKLFKGKTVHFKLGYDAISDDIIQTKVSFIADNVAITAILSCDDTMINSVPVTAIRGRANNIYPYSVNFNKEYLLETITRLMLFTSTNSKEITAYSTFEFGPEEVTIYDSKKENKESLYYNNDTCNITEPYTTMLDLNDLKAVLESCSEQYITMAFGDNQAFLIKRGTCVNVVPEIHSL